MGRDEALLYELQKAFNMDPVETDLAPIQVIAVGLKEIPAISRKRMKIHCMDVLLAHAESIKND